MDRRAFLRNSTGIVLASGFVGQTPKLLAQDRITIPSMADQTLRRIAFGSCNNQNKPQVHWDFINRNRPDLWLWLGDNIYADHKTPEQRFREYQKILDLPSYQKLASQSGILGIWDDHDYASDNSDSSYKDKVISQQLLADFLKVEADHPMRYREGIYRSDTFGPYGQQTQIISLDIRYFKKQKNNGGLLGEVQWDWLERTLRTSSADLLIIATSLHLSSKITGFGLEGWNKYPAERERLYDLLAQFDTPTLILSGDRHMADIIKVELSSGKPIYEIMSSGMTHSTYFYLPDARRQGKIIGDKNFGTIDIDWTSTGPKVEVQIKSAVSESILARFQPEFSF